MSFERVLGSGRANPVPWPQQWGSGRPDLRVYGDIAFNVFIAAAAAALSVVFKAPGIIIVTVFFCVVALVQFMGIQRRPRTLSTRIRTVKIDGETGRILTDNDSSTSIETALAIPGRPIWQLMQAAVIVLVGSLFAVGLWDSFIASRGVLVFIFALIFTAVGLFGLTRFVQTAKSPNRACLIMTPGGMWVHGVTASRHIPWDDVTDVEPRAVRDGSRNQRRRRIQRVKAIIDIHAGDRKIPVHTEDFEIDPAVLLQLLQTLRQLPDTRAETSDGRTLTWLHFLYAEPPN